MMKKIPPYYHNFDSSHCLQCCLRSILEHFNPQKKWTWNQLDKLSNKQKDKPTWHMGFLSKLGKLGYETVCIDSFDVKAFIADPKEYLKDYLSPAAYEYSIKSMDFEAELLASKTLLKAEANGDVKLQVRNSSANDIRKLLKEGYLLIHWVDARKMMQRDGFSGHFVLIYDMLDKDTLCIHDNGGVRAGPPHNQPVGLAEWKVNIDHLVMSATSGNNVGGIYAIRPKKNA